MRRLGQDFSLVSSDTSLIVLDSVAADEWEETRWKARFVTRLDPGLALFETLRATRADGSPHGKF